MKNWEPGVRPRSSFQSKLAPLAIKSSTKNKSPISHASKSLAPKSSITSSLIRLKYVTLLQSSKCELLEDTWQNRRAYLWTWSQKSSTLWLQALKSNHQSKVSSQFSFSKVKIFFTNGKRKKKQTSFVALFLFQRKKKKNRKSKLPPGIEANRKQSRFKRFLLSCIILISS